MALHILVIDDDPGFLQMVHLILKKAGYDATTCISARDGLSALSKRKFDLCLLDLKMPGMDGIAFLRELKTLGSQLTVIVMSAYGSNETAIEAMKQGAYDYIAKPFQPDELLLTIRKAEERERLRRENLELRLKVDKDGAEPRIVFKSSVMARVVGQAQRVASYKTTVLVVGESGTGKELLARLVHQLSPRGNRPFVPVNCGAIPEGLMEAEFFGYVKGAFTDAVSHKQGLIEVADGGTLFLDEVGELPLALQVKLLRFLQDGEVRRVGDPRAKKVDARVIGATAKDLMEEVNGGRFREDLYYRLNVVRIRIPPLRERPEDIEELIDYFLRRTCTRLGIFPPKEFSGEAMKLMLAYDWPGNVRELENVVERAVVLSDSRVIGEDALPENIGDPSSGEGTNEKLPLTGLSVKKNKERLERLLIRKALRASGGNRSQAARLLEMSHRALLYKLKEYRLE